jgi:CheY-like chemotaxis protein
MEREYNILIVDDIFMNRLLIKEIVSGCTKQIFEAENGKQAIEIIKAQPHLDMVLMDIEMPVMNGLETTRFIRNELGSPKCNLPVIALTAHNPDDFFEDFQSAGFNHLLTKPYSIEKVLNLIYDLEKDHTI